MTGPDHPLSDPAFVVLAVLAEAEGHGYEVRRRVHERGFRFWADLGRTSIYNAISRLDREGLIASRNCSPAAMSPAQARARIKAARSHASAELS